MARFDVDDVSVMILRRPISVFIFRLIQNTALGVSAITADFLYFIFHQ